MKIKITTLILMAVLLNCSNIGTELNLEQEAVLTGTSISVSNILVQDANGTALGYYLGGFDILSTTGYIYRVNWDGILQDFNAVYFSSSDCSGAPYTYTGRYPKFGFSYNGNVYKYVNGSNVGSPFSYNSQDANYEPCNTTSGTTDAAPLELTTKAVLGIPATIVGPIVLVPPN